MKTVRLLPIVVLAGSALLGLKLVGLATGGGYTLTGMNAAVAEESAAEAEPETGGEPAADSMTEAEADTAAAQEASELLFGTQGEADIPVVDGIAPGVSTEDVLIERLAQRRAELDALAAELEERMALVEAAELRLDERLAELAAIEASISGEVDAQDEAERAQFMSLVSMYEGMRARDASNIFNELDMDVLVEVGLAMDPRKLGPIVAGMDPTRAQELTVRLAMPRPQIAASAPPAEGAELPQIVGQ